MPQKWLHKKKQAFFEEELSETTGKPKQLWEFFKSLCMASKTEIYKLQCSWR